MSKSQALVWLLLCLLATPTQAEPPGTGLKEDDIRIYLGAEDSWPPYSDAQGQGISTDLVKAAFAKTGLAPTFIVLPYARVLHDLRSGKIDGGYNVTLQTTTKEKYVFGQIPLLTVESYWFFIPGTHPTIKSITDIPDNFRVGIIRDYEYGDAYEHHRHRFAEVQVSQQSQIIRMLKQGRIDAVVMYDREAEYALKEMNLDAAIFDKRFLNHQGNVYVAFSQKTQKAKWLAEQLDKGLLMMKESGEYDRILSDTNKEP
jgi:polar amino acid transport system substrate-binding protein